MAKRKARKARVESQVADAKKQAIAQIERTLRRGIEPAVVKFMEAFGLPAESRARVKFLITGIVRDQVAAARGDE